MQVNGKTLLDSAENILKSRRQENKSQKSEETKSQRAQDAYAAQKTGSDSAQTKLNSARMLKLEAELKSMQESYTREQVRENFLLHKPHEISKKLEYQGGPLFPEYKPGMDTQSLAKDVGYKLKQLLHSLKGIQVEIENLYALNFDKLSSHSRSQEANIKQMDAALAVKDLDPKRVAQLTKS